MIDAADRTDIIFALEARDLDPKLSAADKLRAFRSLRLTLTRSV